MKKAEPGNVISITTTNGETRRAVILFASRYYKNVMLMGMFAGEYREGDEYTICELCDLIEVLVYASQASVKDGDWPIVGKITLPDTGPFTERISAGIVWIQDQEVRTAKREDQGILPVMGVAGDGAVEILIEELAGKHEQSKFTQITIKYTRSLIDKIRREHTSDTAP